MLKKINPIYYISTVYVIFSLILGMFLTNFLIIFLGWNMLLATFVFFLSEMFLYLKKKKVHSLLQWVILGLFILFFPNTLYMLTDFIHLQNYTFFEDYPDIYAFLLKDWLVFMHIVIGALYAAKIGVSSIQNLEVIFKPIFKKYFVIVLSALFLLSSIGIYIGRFMRFNSWDFLQLFSILTEMFQNVSFLFGFIFIFFVLHWICYFLFSKQRLNVI